MRNPFTYLRELNANLSEAKQRIVKEVIRAERAEKELANAKAQIQELHLDLHTVKTYVEVLEQTVAQKPKRDNKNQYDELDIPKK